MTMKKSSVALALMTFHAGAAHAGSGGVGAGEGFGFLIAAGILFALMRATDTSPFFCATFGYLALMCGAIGAVVVVAHFPMTLLLIGAGGLYWMLSGHH